MRILTIVIASTIITTLSVSPLYAKTEGVFNHAPFEACFTPHKASDKYNCNGLLIKHIDAAKNSILMQAYSFTSKPIAKALVRAANRGVTVVAVIDKSQVNARYSKVQTLLDAGIPVYVDYKVAIAHNKVMVIDDQTVETGSYNFTSSAEHRNAENMLVIKDSALAKAYTQNIISRIKNSKLVVDYCQTKKCKVHAWPQLLPGMQTKPPGYLSIPHFKDCLNAKRIDSYSSWCMPATRPHNCPQDSWIALTGINLLPCLSINQHKGGINGQ